MDRKEDWIDYCSDDDSVAEDTAEPFEGLILRDDAAVTGGSFSEQGRLRRSGKIHDSPISTPDLREVRSAWQSWQSDAFVSRQQSQPSGQLTVISDIGSPSMPHMLSPAAFRDQMSRLKKENALMRDDILRFKGTLKV